jgi:hypothetical protein
VEDKPVLTDSASTPKFQIILKRNYGGNLRYELKFSRVEIKIKEHVYFL